MDYLQTQTRKRPKPGQPILRAAAAIAAVAVLALSGLFSIRLYAAPSAYVDLDVNPSFELTLNRFGRVLSARAYSSDGEIFLRELQLRHRPCEQAIQDLLAVMLEQDYPTDGLVSVTVQGGSEQELAKNLQDIANAVLAGHHATADVEVSIVSAEVKMQARNHCVSPAKYLAILELQEIDPAATFEDCANCGLGDLRERAQHGAGHHAETEDKTESGAEPPDQNDYNSGGQHHGQGHD